MSFTRLETSMRVPTNAFTYFAYRNNDTFLNRELLVFKVPTIAVINTNQPVRKIDYPIVANSINIQSIFTLMYKSMNII